jgi:hypothetical protein
MRKRAGPSRFLLGWICPSSANLELHGIPFPGLPKLLLSATHLTDLRLFYSSFGIHFTRGDGHCPLHVDQPRTLHLGFQSPLSLPDRASRRPPPPKRFVLPVLTEFWFKGVSEYVDDLVARIDAPRLIKLDLTFFNQILFDTPELVQFISRTSALKAPEKARVIFEDSFAGSSFHHGHLTTETSVSKSDAKVGLAGFVSGAGLYLVLASLSTWRTSTSPRIPLATRLARQHRELAMAGTIAAIHRCEESLPI